LAPYPEELSDKVVQYYSFVGDTILDPFLGSGTTLISAKKFNRNCVGIELHQEYIDMVNKRCGISVSAKSQEG
jgi:site-specific DNA-methyltransferase (adenine-specific)